MGLRTHKHTLMWFLCFCCVFLACFGVFLACFGVFALYDHHQCAACTAHAMPCWMARVMGNILMSSACGGDHLPQSYRLFQIVGHCGAPSTTVHCFVTFDGFSAFAPHMLHTSCTYHTLLDSCCNGCGGPAIGLALPSFAAELL